MGYKIKQNDLVKMIRFTKEVESENPLPQLFFKKQDNGSVMTDQNKEQKNN